MAQQEAIERALVKYLGAIKPLGVVTELIFAVKPGEQIRVFNVTESDFSRKQVDDPRYRKLTGFAIRLEEELGTVIPTFVSYVNPSQLEDFLQDVSRRGFEFKRLPVTVDILPQ